MSAEKVVPTTTEETPAAPGWVETTLDSILAQLPVTAEKLTPFRAAYLDCLAGCGRTTDLDSAHDSCRMALLRALKNSVSLDAPTLRTLEQNLEKLERDISSAI